MDSQQIPEFSMIPIANCVEDAARLTVVMSDFYETVVLPKKGVFLLNNRWSFDHDREEVAL
jgi:hypothetical protein